MKPQKPSVRVKFPVMAVIAPGLAIALCIALALLSPNAGLAGAGIVVVFLWSLAGLAANLYLLPLYIASEWKYPDKNVKLIAVSVVLWLGIAVLVGYILAPFIVSIFIPPPAPVIG